MFRFLKLVILFIISFSFVKANAHLNFDLYSIDDGLSQSVVNCLHQDSKGFLWIGTQNGLCRFDGKNFEVYSYSPTDTTSISSNWIYDIVEDSQENLWIGTKDGLNKYSPVTNHFKRISYETTYKIDLSHYTYGLAILPNDKIAINTPPILSIFDAKKNAFQNFISKNEYDGSVKDIAIPIVYDGYDHVWIASTTGLSSFNLKMEQFSYYEFQSVNNKIEVSLNVTALYCDKAGTIWAGTNTGLYKFDEIEQRFFQISLKNAYASFSVSQETCVRSISQYSHNELIVGTEGDGIYCLSLDSPKPFVYKQYTSQENNLGNNIVHELLIDRSENLWAGTLNGLNKANLKPQKFELYRNDGSSTAPQLLGNVIASINKTNDESIWIGNWGQGLNRYDLKTGRVEHFTTREQGNHYINNDFVQVIFKNHDGLLWLGTRNGILIYREDRNQFISIDEYFANKKLPNLHDVRIYKIIQDTDNNYWIATQNGLFMIESDLLSYSHFKKEDSEQRKLSANLVYDVIQDSEGLLWIATVEGLDVYNRKTDKFRHFVKGKNELSSDFTITLCEDKDGKIWIGTSTYVNVFDKKTNKFTYLNKGNGIPNNNIYQIIRDKNDNLWLGTGKGLCFYNSENGTFRNYTTDDGLQSMEFNLRAYHQCTNGEILIGGMNGYNAFHPDSIKDNPHIPNIVITSVYNSATEDKIYIGHSKQKTLALNYADNSFSIEFAALEYTDPEKNKFAYQMKGVSDKWIKIGHDNSVNFSALQPGEYLFSVKGSNNDGNWNKEGTALKIIIHPPWYRSTLAYILYVLLIGFLVFVIIKQREQKLKHDKHVLEEKVKERTLQIKEQNQLIVAQNDELHSLNSTKDKFFKIIGHDLGNQFHIIVGFSNILLNSFKKLPETEIERQLTNIHSVSNHANRLLDNLLTWARLQTDSIKYHPEKLKVTHHVFEAIEMLEGANLEKNIDIGVFADDDIEIKADKNMFATIVRNIVNNAIKFTEPNGKIELHLSNENQYCRIKIIDTGVGIPEDKIDQLFKVNNHNTTQGTQGEKGTGLGLVLCKEFMDLHQGNIWVESKENKGSTFFLEFPLESND